MTDSEFAVTDKQIEILQKVMSYAKTGKPIPFKVLWTSLSYGPYVTKQAIQCSIRFLESHGMVERVYGDHYGEFERGLPVFIKPTPDCYLRFQT